MGWKRAITMAAAAGLTLSLAGCGGGFSSLNPLNWFGQAEEVPRITEADTAAGVEKPDPRPLVAQVVGLEIARTPGGAIITARGLPPTQGWWDGELVPANGETPVSGTLSYDFRIVPPPVARRVGPPRSREVVVAHFVTTRGLEGVRAIEVRGRVNALIVRR